MVTEASVWVGIRLLLQWPAHLGATIFNTVVLTPVLCLALYDFTVFQPHAAAIASIIAHADPEDADPPPLVREMLLAAHGGKSGLAVPVARNLLKDKGHVRMSEWPMTFFLWSHLVCLHYSEAEIAAAFSSRAYVGAGRFGLNAAAQARFEKPLSRLSSEEAAEIIAITWSPPLMLADPAALERRKTIILLRYDERRATL